jgi:hypothetical protein
VQDAYITDGHAFPYKVEVDLDMLRALVLNGVGEEVDGADVVVVDEGSRMIMPTDRMFRRSTACACRCAVRAAPGLEPARWSDLLRRPGGSRSLRQRRATVPSDREWSSPFPKRGRWHARTPVPRLGSCMRQSQWR